jgi:hypothetical protein
MVARIKGAANAAESRPTFTHAALAFALALGAFAGACGSPAVPPPETPAGQTDAASGGEAGAAPAETAKKPEGGEATPAEKAPAEAGSSAKSTPVQATQMEADLMKIGIDLNKIPELEKLTLAQKKKVMPLLQKSLGFETCQGCHAEGDFKKETRNIKVAREMWRHFVTPLRTEKGGAVFCDSCHNGEEHILARSDKKAIQAFMEAEYEHKFAQASKADMECGTCHGDAMETKIIEKLWKIAR